MAQDAGAPAALSASASVGEGLFRGKAQCSGCHQVNAMGGIAGPDLSNAGRLGTDALREKIVNPDASPTPGGRGGPSTIIVRTKDGQEMRGIRRSEDTFTLLLMDSSGKLLRLDKRALADQRTEPKSLMPADYAQRLSEAEIGNLVAYLRTLNGRDPARSIQAEIPGGLTFDRLRNAAGRTPELAHLLGRLSGPSFLRTESDRSIERRASCRPAGPCRCQATPYWR